MSDADTGLAPSRRVVLVLVDATSPSHAAIVREAAALAVDQSTTLDVIVLRETSSPPRPALPIQGDATWWDCACLGEENPAAQTMAIQAAEALRQTGVVRETRCVVLLAAANDAEEAAARLAVAIDARALGRCVGLRLKADAVVADREIFGGRARIELRCGADRIVAVLRAGRGATLHELEARMPALRRLSIDTRAPEEAGGDVLSGQDSRPAVDGALLVVSGGRGIGSPDGFELLGRLADKLGGALGGSLPAVDAGWVGAARQIGQSGKFVSPTTYLAVAISGTPQHLAGVSTEARLIAINNDPEAAIFERAEIGVVADWRQFIPLLLEALDSTIDAPR